MSGSGTVGGGVATWSERDELRDAREESGGASTKRPGRAGCVRFSFPGNWGIGSGADISALLKILGECGKELVSVADHI